MQEPQSSDLIYLSNKQSLNSNNFLINLFQPILLQNKIADGNSFPCNRFKFNKKQFDPWIMVYLVTDHSFSVYVSCNI